MLILFIAVCMEDVHVLKNHLCHILSKSVMCMQSRKAPVCSIFRCAVHALDTVCFRCPNSNWICLVIIHQLLNYEALSLHEFLFIRDSFESVRV